MKEEEYLRIERYLKNKMTFSEKIEFENELNNNSQLASDFDQISKLSNGVKVFRFEENLSRNKYILEKNAIKAENNWISILGIAASITIIFTVGFLLLRDSSTTEQIFKANFSPYPNLERMRNNELSESSEAFIAYDNKEYQLAINKFSNLQSKDDRIHFYLGNAYLASGDSKNAIVAFMKISEESLFTELTLWYLGLAYLKEGDTENAQITFEQIPETSIKFGRAVEILEKININED